MENKSILVVDKDTENLSLIESRLQARGFVVTTATASEPALRFLEGQNFDLILIAADMELVNGEEITVRIRKASSSCFVPVIMMLGDQQLAKLLHGVQQGFDDFLIKPFDAFTLQLRVLLNIRRAEDRMQANPLTKLPGNIAIEKTVKDKILSGEKYSVCYLDVNNFKSFNDLYGYDKGDDVIRQAARIIVQAARKYASGQPDQAAGGGLNMPARSGGSGQPFIGHVGGDDFIVVTHPDLENKFAKECIREFDRIIPTYYATEDIKRGHVQVKNRKGKNEKFPIMSISIAAVTNLNKKYSSPAEIAQVAAGVKKFLKTQPGSSYLRDRREKQIESFDEAFEVLPGTRDLDLEKVEPLGQFLLAAGLINEYQLGEALKQHLATGKRLGQVLIAMDLVRSYDVGRMLEKKLGVPYVPLAGRQYPRELSRLFTMDYVRTHRVVPVEITNGKLQIAMCDPFDLKVIDDIERTTGYRVVPGLALEEEFEHFFDKYYNRSEAV